MTRRLLRLWRTAPDNEIHQPAVSQTRPQLLSSHDEGSLQFWSTHLVIPAFEDSCRLPRHATRRVEFGEWSVSGGARYGGGSYILSSCSHRSQSTLQDQVNPP